MSNKQTAVEWLEETISKMEAYGGDLPPLMVHIQQAKEMEKQQIIDFITQYEIKYNNVFSEQGILNVVNKAEQYYKQTFKSK